MEAPSRPRFLALARSPRLDGVRTLLRALVHTRWQDIARDAVRSRELQRVAADGLKRLAQRVQGVAELLDPDARSRARPTPEHAAAQAAVPLDEVSLGLLANDMGERLATVEALATHPEPSALEPLVEALRSTDAEVSIAAMAALVARDEAAGAAALVDVLRDRSGFFLPITRLAAARALQQFSTPPALDAVLFEEYDAEVREVLSTPHA